MVSSYSFYFDFFDSIFFFFFLISNCSWFVAYHGHQHQEKRKLDTGLSSLRPCI